MCYGIDPLSPDGFMAMLFIGGGGLLFLVAIIYFFVKIMRSPDDSKKPNDGNGKDD